MGPRARIILLNVIDALLLNGAVLLALLLRFDGHVPEAYLQRYLEVFYVITLAGLFFLNLFKVHRTLWRYIGLPTALSVANALTLAFGSVYLLNLFLRPQVLPRSVLVLSWILAIGLILGLRLLGRLLQSPTRRSSRTGRRVLIVGAGDVGVMVARELSRTLSYAGYPIGFVDDDPNKQHARIENLEVIGTTFDLPRLIEERRVGEVIIAAASAPPRLIRQVVRVCLECRIGCRRVPALADYIEGRAALDQVREIRIEDLLGRGPIEIDLPGIRQRLSGSTVLVTGAGGSIGSELCRQIARFSPGRLVILDHNENSLTYLGLELRENDPALDVVHVVGDIKDAEGMLQLLEEIRPDLVFHAAAHKHVNLLEARPREAILNNVLGTRNVARACDRAKVRNLVLISTDKAVNPSSVMGASKRVCEMLLQGFSRRSETTMTAVRFGNVIGSEGSVLPIFRRQLARGGPLTVTHPEARRYFMTIPEASQLVIQSALIGQPGDVFILDMGEPVRILDVARQLIRLSGMVPDRDVSIAFIGLRPGEKLSEELLTHQERTRTTRHEKIFRCELEAVDPEWIEREAEEMIQRASGETATEIRARLRRVVPEYLPEKPEPLPREEPVKAPATTGPAPHPLPAISEPLPKRLADVIAAGTSLALLAVPTFFAWVLVQVSGPATVTFRSEVRIGRNRRRADRRRGAGAVGIDRRETDRRRLALPGRPFVTYRVVLDPGGRANPLQKGIYRFVRRFHLDRILYLWNVLKGEMSLVGPSAHLVESETWKQDAVSAWCFARKPGLTGPSHLLGGEGELAVLYDRYYARHGNWHLDLDALRRALPRLARAPRGRRSRVPLTVVTETRKQEGGIVE
ncbi:MAG: NAD-dependent epimerase/dehydratase family protein [Candidatus Eisenbacteria bacterium]|nr:NAD-dependent epimerase/dehydratase family protein [Candidatus Latescibacterota bacterium]MBD3303426.1 NAD-dependent epimerase/dehydratase family protein [Candidatus Eisenbacteria bacterium]